MQNHHRRFVLVAGLVAATAAAQSPSLDTSKFREVGSQEPQGRSTPQEASGRTIGDYSPRYSDGYQDRQNDDKYTLVNLFTQNHGDFMNRRERYDADIDLAVRYLPTQRINHEPGTFDMLGYDFDIEVPMLVSTDGYLKFGAYYQGRSYVFSNAFGSNGNPPGSMPDEVLHAAGLKLGFGVFLDDNWLFEFDTAPGVWSDADEDLHHEDYDFPSSMLFTVRAVDNLFLKFGARYNQIYEEAPWLPYLGLSVELDAFRVDVLAPESLEVSFWPSAATGILAGVEVTGGEYHVRTNQALGSQRDDLNVQEVIVYLGLVHRMSDFFSFRGRAGAVVAGDYDLTNGAAGFDRVEGALDQGLYAEIALGFDF